MKYADEGNNGNFFRDDEKRKTYETGIRRALRIYKKEVTGACSGISREFRINGEEEPGEGYSVRIPGHGSEESRKIMESIMKDLKSLGSMVKSSKNVLIRGRNEEGKINALKRLIYDIGARFGENPELKGLFDKCGDALGEYGEAIPFQEPPEYTRGGDLELDDPKRPWD